MLFEEEQNSEFSSLMKKMGSSYDDLGFVQKLQQSLMKDAEERTAASSDLTVHVGIGKAAIDLPTDPLEVGKGSSVKVFLKAHRRCRRRR